MSRLVNIPLVAPGSMGLNLQTQSSLLSPEWCIEARNMVIDRTGRLTGRKGWVSQLTSPLTGTPTVEQLFEYKDNNGNTTIVSSGGGSIFSGTGSPNDVTGTLTPSNNNWKFQNFDGKVVGWQLGENPIVADAVNADFEEITVSGGGTIPTGNDVLAAYGRLWAFDSTHTVVRWSSLLDENTWDDSTSPGSAGNIDLTSVWTKGMDEGVALAAFNNYLVIFGKNSILVYEGVSDPNNNLSLVEGINGTGCVGRDTVQSIGNDLLFLSYSGLRSLSRTLVQNKMPMSDLSYNVRDVLQTYIDSEDPDLIRSVYSQKEAFYLLNFPTSGITFCFDIRRKTDNNTYRVTTWDSINPRALAVNDSGEVFTGHPDGEIGKYTGFSDNGDEYFLKYTSGWMDVGRPEIFKILKRIGGTFRTGANETVTFRWAFDFTQSENSIQKDITGFNPSEYGIAEYGIAVYSGGAEVSQLGVPLTGYGQFIKIGVSCSVDSEFAIQTMNFQSKLGRVA